MLITADDTLVDVGHATNGAFPADPMVLLGRLNDLRGADFSKASGQPLDGRRLEAPVIRPQKILGAGINYHAHAEEAKLPVPQEPALFAKLPSAICGPYDQIVIPDGRDSVDWEAELVVVIGRRGKNVPAAEAWSHVAALTCGQDISDRKEQFRDLKQFTIGKSFDTYAPIGPVLVTPDEFDDRNDVQVICRLNGAEVQSGRTSDCIFSVPELISWLSRACTLEVGDLIFTGTPPGVGYIRQPPQFLAEGDILETEIPGIGTMRNPCTNGHG
jgi:2,4-didehydro-3-deoxy-L-rhamnonate hydrolase